MDNLLITLNLQVINRLPKFTNDAYPQEITFGINYEPKTFTLPAVDDETPLSIRY